MGLLDKIKKPLDDYIAVSHFIKKLSGINNFPVFDVITYLNHYDFVEKINAFYLDMDFKIIPFHSVDYQNLKSKLNKLQAECLFTDFVWASPIQTEPRHYLTATPYANTSTPPSTSVISNLKPYNARQPASSA